MSAVWRESASTGRARLVLLAIADMQGEIGAWPSISTLANMVNSSERSVQRDIKYLEEIGELIIFERQAPTRAIHKSNLYWVNLPSVAHKHSGCDEVTNSVDEVTNTTHEVTNGDDEVTAGGVITITRTITNPLLNNIPQNDIDESFNLFWKTYPRKSARDEAMRAFRKALKRASFDSILAGTIRLVNDPNKPEKQFIPYPATWLNRGGWEDEPYPVRISNKEARQAQAIDTFLNAFQTSGNIKEIE